MKFKLLIIAIAVFSLSACDTKKNDDPEVIDSTQTEEVNDGNVLRDKDGNVIRGGISGVGIDEGSGLEPTRNPADVYAREAILSEEGALGKKVYYFDFDSSQLSDEDIASLQEHGRYLTVNPDVNVRLVGHTDERGTPEYNIALGQERSEAVQRVLFFQGALSEQMDAISFGELKPVEFGHDESAWQLNRRVELIYDVQ